MSDFHKRVPREFKKNLRWRRFVLRKAKNNPVLQRALWSYCAKDAIFYINTFVWQTNPNEEDETIGPFITWPFQERAVEQILWCIANKQSVVIEKSREMGATWLVLIVKDWKCRFKHYYDSLMMSKSEKAVDSPSRQSLFGKLRFIHSHLPRWLHDENAFLDNKSSFGYPVTHSTQTGFSSTGKAGVSERGGDFFIDEFTQIDEDWEVLYRTQATSKCRIFVATHMGLGTAFYHLTQNESHFRKIVFHWTQHPTKNKGMYRWNKVETKMEWLRYNEETDELDLIDAPEYRFPADYEFDKSGDPVGGPHPGVRSPAYDHAFKEMAENKAEMAKDWDINPSGSVAQFYNPLVIRQLIDQGARPPIQEYELEYDKETGLNVKLVPMPGSLIKLWCNLDVRGRPAPAFYGAGTDISGGQGNTPSCLSIWNANTGEKVLEYCNPGIRPHEFAIFTVALCRLFADAEGNGAKLAWEHAGPGATFGLTAWKQLGYTRVYCRESDERFNSTVSDVPGWNPAPKTILALHTQYRQALYERKASNHSRSALDETLNFKHNGRGSVEHTQYVNKQDPASGRENHGDIVVADALGWKMIKNFGKTLEIQAQQVAQPGTLAYLWQEEERRKSTGDELYPEWQGKYTPFGKF